MLLSLNKISVKQVLVIEVYRDNKMAKCKFEKGGT